MSLIARYPLNGDATNKVVQNGTYTVVQSSTGATWGLRSAGDFSDTKASQTITMPSGSPQLSYITLQLAKSGSPTGTMTMKVYSGQGTGLIATSTNTISESSLTGSYVSYTFNFSNESVTGGIGYYFTLETTRTDTANYVYGNGSAADLYAGGVRYKVNDSGTYTAQTNDMVFTLGLSMNIGDGTASNVSWVDGKENGAASLSGAGTSNILLPTSLYDQIKTRNDYWIDFWVYPKASNGIIYSYTYGGDFYFHITSDNKISIRRGTNVTTETGTSAELNKWQKFTINYTSDTNAALYKNGNFIQNFTISATPNVTTQFKIGGYYDTTFPFNGIVDRWQIGTGNLSVAEIKNDYFLTTGYYG